MFAMLFCMMLVVTRDLTPKQADYLYTQIRYLEFVDGQLPSYNLQNLEWLIQQAKAVAPE